MQKIHHRDTERTEGNVGATLVSPASKWRSKRDKFVSLLTWTYFCASAAIPARSLT